MERECLGAIIAVLIRVRRTHSPVVGASPTWAMLVNSEKRLGREIRDFLRGGRVV